MSIYQLTMHPASEGDALVLAWGDADDPHHAVIDLGRSKDYKRLRPWLTRARRIELFVMSHIDADHIAGAMPLVREKTPPFAPADVWFNGYRHLAEAKKRAKPMEVLSIPQGDKLEAGIESFEWPWNKAFDGGPVSTGSPQTASPIELPGGLRVTLLSPSDGELATLEKDWNDWLEKNRLRKKDPDEEKPLPPGIHALSVPDVEGLAAEPFNEDDEPPNGSSIALLAEFRGKRVLLGADAHPSRVAASLEALGYRPDNRLRLDLFKLCHHGSKGNTSKRLLDLIDCTNFAISTDGTRHNHPNPQTIARILVADPNRAKVFNFNFRQKNAEIWDDAKLKLRWRYDCNFPEGAEGGLTIDLE